MDNQSVIVFLSSLLLGFRHGVDWDHIAAITNLVGTESKTKQGMFLAAMYSLGHALVILILGIGAVALSKKLPLWIDTTMERFVAVTLILLGLLMFISIIRHWHGFEMRSRWHMVTDGVRQLKYFVTAKLLKKDQLTIAFTNETIGRSGAFAVGIIHGFGAETPTQILLLSTAAGMSSIFFGSSVVICFVIGLLLSTSVIAVLTVVGFVKARFHASVYRLMGCVTAAYSFSVGIMILLKV